MTNEQPEQWAKDLLEAVQDASDIGMACGMVDCPQCANAALTIQRAFAEHEAELVAENAKLREAADRAWIEARELVIGTNADLCKGGAGQAYRLIIEGLTNAINKPELRTLAGRVASLCARRQALAQQDTTALKSREAGHG